MRSQFLQLMLHVFFDVLESVEKGRRDGGGASAVLDARAQLLLGGVHQAAVGVVDDHEFLGFQQVVGDKQRAQGVVGDDARSEEHTSELQSLTNLVCRLLLEKKKQHPGKLSYGEDRKFR